MMYPMRKVLSLLFLAVSLTACFDGFDGGSEQDPLSMQHGVSITDVSVPPTGGVVAFTISTRDSWVILDAPSWISFNANQGKAGVTQVHLTAPLNDAGIDRSGSFSIACDGESVSVHVSQEAPYLTVRSTSDSFKFEWSHANPSDIGSPLNSTPETISIYSNIDWSIGSDANHLFTDCENNHYTFSQVAGFGSKDITVIPTAVNLSESHHGLDFVIVPLTPDGSRISNTVVDHHKFSMDQGNLRFLVNGTGGQQTVSFNDLGDEKATTLVIDSETAWEVKAPSWVEVSPSRGTGMVNMTVKAKSANPTTEPLDDRIRLVTQFEGAVRYINIHQDGYLFELGTENLAFDPMDLGEKHVKLRTHGTWTINSVPSDIKFTPRSNTKTTTESGVDSFDIVIQQSKPNLKFEDVVRNLSFKCGSNGMTKDFSITQKAFIFKVDAPADLTNLDCASTSEKSVRIECSGKWEITNVPEWLQVSPVTGEGNTTIKVAPKSPNTDSVNDRKTDLAVVSVTHKENNVSASRTISVLQRHFLLDVKTKSAKFDTATASSEGVAVDVDCSTSWKAAADADWVLIQSGEKTGNGTFVINVKDNETERERTAKVVISSTLGGKELKQTVSVTQAGLSITLGKNSFKFASLSAASDKTSFSTTGEYSMESDADWISYSVENGFLTIGASDNFSTKAREGHVTVKSRAGNKVISKSVSVTQDAYVFDVNESSMSFSYDDKSSKAVVVKCTADWTVTADATWVKIDKNSGNGDGSFSISVDKNSANDKRTSVVKVTTHGMEKTISISQEAAPASK